MLSFAPMYCFNVSLGLCTQPTHSLHEPAVSQTVSHQSSTTAAAYCTTQVAPPATASPDKTTSNSVGDTIKRRGKPDGANTSSPRRTRTTCTRTRTRDRYGAQPSTVATPKPSPAQPLKKNPYYLKRRQFAIRSTDRHARWYDSRGGARLDAPPDSVLSPRHGDLYVHRDEARGRTQMWLYLVDGGVGAGTETYGDRRQRDTDSDSDSSSDSEMLGTGTGRGPAKRSLRPRRRGAWVDAYSDYTVHPNPGDTLQGYVLHLRDDGTPRWVKQQSAKMYASGKGRRKRLRSAMSS